MASLLSSRTAAVVMYMLCSSTMLVSNKLAISLFPAPNLLLLLQLASSALILWLLGMSGRLKVDALEWEKLRAYWVVAAVFLLNIYTNIMALKTTTVETVIVFRSLTTVIVAVCDWRGQPLTAPVLSTLIAIVICCAGYVHAERSATAAAVDGTQGGGDGRGGDGGVSGLSSVSLCWSFAYLICQSVDCVYIKHIVSTVDMTSWGRSYYNNLLAMGPLLAAWVFSEREREAQQLAGALSYATAPVLAVLLSCVLGLCISVTAFHCRKQVDATSYSVIGNMNKVLTVLINCAIWNKHASAAGVAWLMGCLFAGYIYSVVKVDDALPSSSRPPASDKKTS
eukprot:Tamp_19998.p1 GENE.Tamp_19998~~Tamp_19998.p1  ORF type:complete len:338 (-),score=46.44 Tamp_19998:202-1215(-)